MINNGKRLIEVDFPLEQVSLDSVHEKNVRHGHISTLHIWPARRPLAASRAALIATLLPDPGDPQERQALLERLAGRVVEDPRPARRSPSAVSCTGGANRDPTSPGSESESAKPTADVLHVCSTRLLGVARSRLRRCAWAAR